MPEPHTDDAWAEVELYRWQHGELPPQDETCKALSVPDGLEGMARAFDKPASETNAWPMPFNIAIVLRYVARLIKSENKETGRSA